MKKSLSIWLATALVSGLTVLGSATSAPAAEKIKFRYGIFDRSIPFASLEIFATDGILDDHLKPYLGGLEEDALEQLRDGISTPRQIIDPVVFTQMLYSPMGERLLQSAGLTVQTGKGMNGQTALRGALIKAAFEPEGLALINVIRHFPTESMNLNLRRGLAVKRYLEDVVQQTNELIAFVQEQSAAASAASSFDYSTLLDLREPGPYAVKYVGLSLNDETRNRPVPADVFFPNIPTAANNSIPVVVLSHGLGDSRIYFRDIAEHLASYGFAVTLPEHVGSNEGQRQKLESWLSHDFFEQREFINRPQDVSFLLDQLTELNPIMFNNQLNVETVGAVGHSFGGYTVLSLAGATVDFDELHQQCDIKAAFAANLSQLLQCRALELENSPEDIALLTQGSLRDERIKMIMGFNPVSHLFGEFGISQIDVPTFLAGGAYDFVTPIVPEQIDTFRWLETPEQYFVMADQTAHSQGTTRLLFQFIYAVDDSGEIETAEQWRRSNYTALLIAFAQIHLANQEQYRPYLEAGYVENIGVDPFLMHLVRELPEEI